MSNYRIGLSLLTAAAALSGVSTAHGQFTASALNTFRVADGPNSQGNPRVIASADGGSYVSWDETLSADVRLQRLNSAGVEQWPHGGVLIADRTLSSQVIGGDLALAADGSCFICFDDTTDAGSPSVRQAVVQKVSAAGQKLWGTGGQNLSLTSGAAGVPLGPQVAAMPDGGCVVAWSKNPSPSTISILRLDADGNTSAGWTGPITITEPGFPLTIGDIQVVDGSGSFVVLWIRASSTAFTANRYLYTQKFSAAGVPQWNGGNPVDIFSHNQGTAGLGVGVYFNCIPDGAGGAVYGWCETTLASPNASIQHVLSDGTIKFNDGGSPAKSAPISSVSPFSANNTGRVRLNAVFAYNSTEGSYFIASSDRKSNPQTDFATFVQKISSSGQLEWGDDGIYVVPVVSGFNGSSLPLSIVADSTGGCMVFGIDNRGQTTTKRVIFAASVDNDGAVAWNKILNTDVTTDKSNRMGVCKVSGSDDAIVAFGWGSDNGDIGIARVSSADGSPAVTPECVNIAVDAPAAIGACQGDTVVIPITVTGTEAIAYQWQKGHWNTGNFVNLGDGPTSTPFFTADGSSHSGSFTATLTITNAQPMTANLSKYQCTMINACPGLPVATATTIVTVTAPGCPGDFDCNGTSNINDIFVFLNAWFSGAPRADFNQTGGITIDDIFVFLNAWFGSSC